MFTKKLEDQFSVDLLNTVRGILGESKHDKECECEKCEEEDEDEEDEAEEENGKKKMKEGFASAAQRKAVWATYADGGKGHPDKKKKMKKEEAEIDEGIGGAYRYNQMMKRRRAEYDTMYTKHMAAGDDHETAKMKTQKHFGELEAKRRKSARPLPQTRDLMKKEEVEQIDEIGNTPAGKRALGRYVKDRRSTILGAGMGMERQHKDHSVPDQQRKDLGRRAWNAHIGVGRAVDRLTKEEAEQIDELSKATMGRYINKAATKIGTQGVTAGLKIASDENSKKNFKDMGKREKGIARAVTKLTKEEQDFIDSLNNSNLEQIDELSDKALVRYDAAAKDDVGRLRRKADAEGRVGSAKRAVKDADKADQRTRSVMLARKKLKGIAKVPAVRKEEVELEEGRGRPPKEGSAAWHAKQKQATDDMPALGMQLRKAKSMNKKVRFMDNKEHEIHPSHVDRFEDHMAARKTSQDKAAFQKQAHKSHADFVKAVSAPVPKSSKDTGEIVKYRH